MRRETKEGKRKEEKRVEVEKENRGLTNTHAPVPSSLHLLRRRRDGRDVRVTGVRDRKHGHAVQLAAGRPQLDVGPRIVVDGRLGEHGVVVDLGAADRRDVGGDDDELACKRKKREGRERERGRRE